MSGPYEKIGGSFPLYLLQFNKAGEPTSPGTTTELLANVRNGEYTHIYLISHGWNNGFGEALGLYRDFFNLFAELRSKYFTTSADPWRPVFIGLHWPSIILLLPWETGPRIAAGGEGDAVFESFSQAKELIAEGLPPGDLTRFYDLTGRDRLSETEARELARVLSPVYRSNALDIESAGQIDLPEDGILAAWMSMPDSAVAAAPDYSAHGRAQPSGGQVRAASALSFLDPRNAIRVTTVLMMKDRAGDVGRFGLTPLLKELIPAAGAIPIRLVGHSYGARVCLTALSSPDLDSLRVSSLLLLQPAVNQYCFADSVPGLGLGMKGGFVPALSRTGLPVFTTFSSNDAPLHTFFHLAARRIEDRGEIRFASAGPSEFSALGGYGPDGVVPLDAVKTETIHPAAVPYNYDKNVKVLALDGSSGQITGHGDVRTEYTCWALLSQEMANVL